MRDIYIYDTSLKSVQYIKSKHLLLYHTPSFIMPQEAQVPTVSYHHNGIPYPGTVPSTSYGSGGHGMLIITRTRTI
jgi:hypothetical protein